MSSNKILPATKPNKNVKLISTTRRRSVAIVPQVAKPKPTGKAARHPVRSAISRSRSLENMESISSWMQVAQLPNMEKIKQIRQGFDAVMLKTVGEYFNLPEIRVLNLMGVPKTTAHRLMKKHERLNQNDSERLYRVAMVTQMAVEVFCSDENAKEWLTKPNFALQNEAPLDMLDTEPGAEIVKRILNAIETGGVL